jgi:hypothetical protein
MIKIVIDEVTQARLGNLEQPAELCDVTGRILGYLTPAEDRSVYDELESPNGEEELLRREREGGGRLLSEILGDFNRRT